MERISFLERSQTVSLLICYDIGLLRHANFLYYFIILLLLKHVIY